ncbi:hypothetical protein L6164_023068 [Bauhinia variegata]|uniref:Uncharacterized protein n=1 Tax=Bauhinia variegata TaxID=167791 RepID=A0ACB9MHJ2_BAUVA|nr:hypothetical protein L6164_023068 [Bauhinia variegata]
MSDFENFSRHQLLAAPDPFTTNVHKTAYFILQGRVLASLHLTISHIDLDLGHVDDYRLRSTPPAGTVGYLDPCYVTSDNLSTKNDVFSFGILLLEIIGGRKAIDITYSPPSIVDWAIPLIKKGKLLAVYDPRISPPKDPIVRKQLAVIAAKCEVLQGEKAFNEGDCCLANWVV